MNHFRSFPDSSNGVSGAEVAARRTDPVCDSQARSRPEAYFYLGGGLFWRERRSYGAWRVFPAASTRLTRARA